MKTSIIAASLIACSFFVSVASAQSLHIGVGNGQLMVHGSRGGHVQRQSMNCEHVGGIHGRQRMVAGNGGSLPIGTPSIIHVSEWSEWRPVGPTLPQHVGPRLPRPAAPVPNSPDLSDLFGPTTPISSPTTPRPQVVPTPQPIAPRPAAGNPLLGTWKASDRVVRIEAGQRFSVAWMNNGRAEQASGTYLVHGKTIIFKSDAGEVWPWKVEGYVNGQLTMSHAEAGSRVFQKVNG